jgi:triosephosphate isomerase (TIM)
MSARIPVFAGNWKMNTTVSEGVALAQGLRERLDGERRSEVILCPPFTHLTSVRDAIAGSTLLTGAQNLYWEPKGAYTGEVSAAMLAKLGCSYVVVGHSERRQHHHEDDALVNAKARQAHAAKMTPIVCIGEGLDVRQAGDHVPYTLRQLDGSLAGFAPAEAAGLVVAYEPVWAIGTGEVATPKDAQEVCAAIRARVSQTHGAEAAAAIRVLYGGSVKAANVGGIMAEADVDGCLVGGASLDADEFGGICRWYAMPVL